MALTKWDDLKYDNSQEFDFKNFYYEPDKIIVMDQKGAQTGGLINMKFRKEVITVFAAKDGEGQVLSTVALPCPPYHHETVREAIPGNFLMDEGDPPTIEAV